MDENPWQTPLNKKEGGERKNKSPWKPKNICKIVTLV
jgi:hypothetical protein